MRQIFMLLGLMGILNQSIAQHGIPGKPGRAGTQGTPGTPGMPGIPGNLPIPDGRIGTNPIHLPLTMSR